MTRLAHIRQGRFLTRQQLGLTLKPPFPVRSIEMLEEGTYTLAKIDAEGRSQLEQILQRALNTTLSLPELLSEA